MKNTGYQGLSSYSEPIDTRDRHIRGAEQNFAKGYTLHVDEDLDYALWMHQSKSSLDCSISHARDIVRELGRRYRALITIKKRRRTMKEKNSAGNGESAGNGAEEHNLDSIALADQPSPPSAGGSVKVTKLFEFAGDGPVPAPTADTQASIDEILDDRPPASGLLPVANAIDALSRSTKVLRCVLHALYFDVQEAGGDDTHDGMAFIILGEVLSLSEAHDGLETFLDERRSG